MTTLDEARRYRSNQPDPTAHLAGADEPDVTPDQIQGMINSLLTAGHERMTWLEDIANKRDSGIERFRDGTYWIRHSYVGQYADFYDRANHAYLKEKYPWLHQVSEGLGFDEDKGAESHGSLENFLGSINDDDWNSFVEDIEGLDDYPVLDEDGASQLEMEEQGRWMSEDGAPELRREMATAAHDGYEAYLLSKVPDDLIWDWCRETEHYPEAQGQGDVWMDMDKFGKDEEVQQWFLDHMEDDHAGWLAAKRAFFDGQAGNQFDTLLKQMAQKDERIATVYNQLDAESVWQLFLKALPDEMRDGGPYWYRWPRFGDTGKWVYGYAPEDRYDDDAWKEGYTQVMQELPEQAWFEKLLLGFLTRAPEGHPEFKFEAQEDPGDPAVFIRYGGGFSEEIVDEDGPVTAFYPRDANALNYHLRNLGLLEVDQSRWSSLRHQDIFIFIAKEAPDLTGHEAKRELGIVTGDDRKLTRWGPGELEQLLREPTYGKHMHRILLRYYRERSKRENLDTVLLQLGGPKELRRLHRRGELSSDIKYYGTALGLHYAKKHQYGLAAKNLGISRKRVTPAGVWLIYDAVEDLLPVFRNEDSAQTVFGHDHHDWFDYYYENVPKVEDVLDFLDDEAIKHIREVMVNRRVWFPDAGPDGRGEYVVLTPKILAEYDDDTILDWLKNPSDEDEEEGTFEDIIKAIQYAGVDILTSTAQDAVYTGYVETAVSAIDGKEHKWSTHPSKKYKSGEAMNAFMVFVPWRAVFDAQERWQENNNDTYSGSLEDLMVDANRETVEGDASKYEPSWSDVNKDWAKENLDRIYDLEAPAPIPGSPEYQDPNQLALALPESADLDSPEAMSGVISGIPAEFERQVSAILRDEYGYEVGPVEIKLAPYFPHAPEDIDASDGRLYNMLPHQKLTVVYDPGQDDWQATGRAFKKVQGAAINTFRWYRVDSGHVLNPDEGEPESAVVFYFDLWEKPKPEPEPVEQGEEVPF